MMKRILLLLLASLPSAYAHVEPGLYTGTTPTGKACSMIAIRSFFENGLAHPLNERVVLQVGNDVFTVGHPPVVSPEKSVVHFNHDFFQGLLPFLGGAKALIIGMNHEEGKEGPTGFTFLEHQWKSDARMKIECRGLVFRR
jgi:hypothetical protein